MTDPILDAADLDILSDDRGRFILRCRTTGLYRTTDLPTKPFAWVDVKMAAAKFRTREDALAVAAAYAAGSDVEAMKANAIPGTKPADLVYPPPRTYAYIWKHGRNRAAI